jgi:hypothetical protein
MSADNNDTTATTIEDFLLNRVRDIDPPSAGTDTGASAAKARFGEPEFLETC